MRGKILLALLLMLTLLSLACSDNSDAQPDDGDVSVSFNINEPKLKTRLGDDDGYAFAIFYGADIDGSLETCG